MAAKPPDVLEADELNETDGKILDLLQDGRVTPPLVRDKLGISREYASERLIRLHEHDHADRPAPGLYELVAGGDPREDGSADDTESPASGAADSHETESAVDIQALQRALDDIEAAAERGNGNGLQEAIKRAREAIDDE